MRFLKNKIFKAQEALKKRNIASLDLKVKEQIITEVQEPAVSCEPQNPEKKVQKSRSALKKEDASTKNIAVNYAQAIASFAISNLAVPYLESRLQNEDLTVKEFVNYIKSEKTKMGGICSFRARLVVEENDNAKVANYKRVFKWIAEIFIKYFSVNWIIHGKVSHKEIYLKFRHKMLRRVQNPESFTYIKERKVKKEASP